MDSEQAYNLWAENYDSVANKTRDLEAHAMKAELAPVHYNDVLEIGCGTGKNTAWFVGNDKNVLGVDLSENMLAYARTKITSGKVRFLTANILHPWTFTEESFDLITFSLVLEHIPDLKFIFTEAVKKLKPEAYIYVGELHPHKQYMGSKARFQTEDGIEVVPCFNHHISDFVNAAKNNGLQIIAMNEYFDEGEQAIPRILVLVFQKPAA